MSALRQEETSEPLRLVFQPAAGDRLRKARRWLKHRLCFVVNGGHELYRQHEPGRIYQRCLLCGHQTRGWTGLGPQKWGRR